MTHTESTPTTEPADSLDDLRAQLTFARDLVDALETTIASAEADEQDCNHDDGFSSSAPDASQVPHDGMPAYDPAPARSLRGPDFTPPEAPLTIDVTTPFNERALDASDAIIDMTGMAVTSTAAVLAIRAAVQYRADQAQARYLAVQHGSYIAGVLRAMVARDTWREALALVDTVIAERMS